MYINKQPTINKKTTKNFNAKINDYQIESIIGQGTYGKVKLATHIITQEQVAIKFVEKSKLIRINDNERIQTEMKIISELNHPNILKAFEIFQDETFFYIVMERPTKGDLFNYVCSKKRLSLSEATSIFYQLVNAIEYIHKNKVVHRDMKPENIMITEDHIIKIGDFGLSRHYEAANIKLETTCGSPCYSAPEMLRGNKYFPKPLDIWGLGIMLYVMICGELPFDGDNEDVLYRKVVQCEYSFPHFCNNNVKNLIKRIFTKNPSERITIEEIKKSPVYMTGKANFAKEFKIYGDDGEVLPIVKKYIKDKTLKTLQEECDMELTKKIEDVTAYKIIYYKYLHKTQWSEFYIPSRLDKITEVQEKTIKIDEDDEPTTSRNKRNIDKVLQTNNNKENNSTLMETLLQIPEHQMIGSSYAMTGKVPKTKNNNKDIIYGVSKLGIVTHSFDKNGLNIEKNRKVQFKSAKKINKRVSSSIPKKQSSTMNSTPMKGFYTRDDYERDLLFLKKQKYRSSSQRLYKE